jgi:hypothetical protein
VEYTADSQYKTRVLFLFCGFLKAVADGVAQAVVGRKGTEDDGHAAAVEISQAREEGLGEGGVVVKGVPAEDFDVAVVDGPVLREHDTDFFLVCDQLNEAVVEFGFSVDEDEAGARGVVTDTYAGGGEALRFGCGLSW